MNIEDFKTYISSLGNAFRVSKGTALNKRKINLIQKRMDFKFPQDYIDFLNCFGSLHIEELKGNKDYIVNNKIEIYSYFNQS